MSNKKIFKEMYSKKINKNKNFEEIVNNINNSEVRKNYKWILVPLCVVFILCISIIIDSNSSVFKDKNNNYNNINCEVSSSNCLDENNTTYIGKDGDININQVQYLSQSALRWDAIYKNIKLNELPKEYDFVNNIYFNDKDLELSNVNKIIVNSTTSKNDYQNEDIVALINYELFYSNKENTKNIKISFSKYNKPIRDYYFSSENSKKSFINNHEFIIYKYEDIYMVEFIYNNIYFDIETENISELQLVLLLESIVL